MRARARRLRQACSIAQVWRLVLRSQAMPCGSRCGVRCYVRVGQRKTAWWRGEADEVPQQVNHAVFFERVECILDFAERSVIPYLPARICGRL